MLLEERSNFSSSWFCKKLGNSHILHEASPKYTNSIGIANSGGLGGVTDGLRGGASGGAGGGGGFFLIFIKAERVLLWKSLMRNNLHLNLH